MIRLRVLPVPVAPLPGELIGSYLNRLADANHLTIGWISHLVGDGRHHYRDRDDIAYWTPRCVTNLALLTGRTETALRHALPALRDGLGRRAHQHSIIGGTVRAMHAPACRLCAARRGILGLAIQHTYPHQRICQQHQRWRGQGPQRPLPTLLPEVLTANRRHRRLTRGPLPPLTASWHHGEAQQLTAAWLTDHTGPTELLHRWQHRLGLLEEDPYGDPHRPSPDRIELVTYPETVWLTYLRERHRITALETLLTHAAPLLEFAPHQIPDLLAATPHARAEAGS